MPIVLFLDDGGGPKTVEVRNSSIPLISGDEYRLIFRVRSTVIQSPTIIVDDSTGASVSLSSSFDIDAVNTWYKKKFEFTAVATDELSRIRISPSAVNQSFYLDGFELINLSKEKKEYRIMRIQGSILPGSFIQTLTLREKTANETA